MENLEVKAQGPGIFKPALNHALMISGALIMYTLILYLTGNMLNQNLSYISFVIAFGGTVYALISHRNQNLGGYISFGQCVGYSLLLGLIIGVITGLFTFILYSYIAPELVEELRTNAEQELLRRSPNMPEDQLDMALNVQSIFMQPWIMALLGLLGGVIQGVIFGLIGGLFVKKSNPNPLGNLE